MYKFDVKKTTQELIQWIKDWFEVNGRDCNAVIGISGGKDSTIVAKLCCEALGKDRVIGVRMPNGVQRDIQVAIDVCKYLGIKSYECDISYAYEGILRQMTMGKNDIEISQQTKINLPARLRMSTLYAISQSMNGRVANTCNLSEDWVGYATRYGDGAGDFSPLSNLTVSEVKQVGDFLELPKDFVYKIPIDGLCGQTDEDNLGFSYDVLDKYIREGICEDNHTKTKIDIMNKANSFKLKFMDCFKP